MKRTYLYVPPEERSEAEALGAQWDAATKCWYADGEPSSGLARWCSILENEGYGIVSNDAYAAIASVPCPRCGQATEVICVHCSSGAVLEQELERFTVSDIQAMDEHLLHALKRWPLFHRATEGEALGDFANHCAACGAGIGDNELHSEPDQVFFDIAHAEEGAVTLVPLPGTIRLSGNEHFVIG